MRDLTKTPGGAFKSRDKRTRTTSKKLSVFGYIGCLSPHLVSWRASKHVLFLGLFFGCQLLAECELQTMTKTVRKGPGSMAHYSISYDGPNPSSVFEGLEKAGFSRTRPERQPSGLRGSGLEWLGSGFGFNPFSNMEERRKQTEKQIEALRKYMFDDIDEWGQGQDGMIEKPNQLSWSQINGSGEDRNNDGSWSHPSVENGDAGGRRRRNGQSGVGATSDNFAQECLGAHNEYRAKHGVPPLRLNSQLSQVSQQWAEHLANDVGALQHRPENQYGENIYSMWSSNPALSISGRDAVDDWYAEIKKHDFSSPSGSSGSNHFSQVIWRGSSELGVGFAKGRGGKIFVVCNYNPAGNVGGQYLTNVPPVGGNSNSHLENKSGNNGNNLFGDPSQIFGGLHSLF